MAERLHLSPRDIDALTVEEFDSAVAYLKPPPVDGRKAFIQQAQRYGEG